MKILGIDVGSSSVKVSVLDALTGISIASSYSPASEMAIIALKPGWAEQDPDVWYMNLINAIRGVFNDTGIDPGEIEAIGISYQMHGLVIVDGNLKPVRHSIIWCDSRAVEIGNNAFGVIGSDYCISNLLNSPGNFTASKLAWVKENEPALYKRIHKVMLPGDYIAMKLTGELSTTISGLSEGVLWDFKEEAISDRLMDYFGFDREMIPELVPVFGLQGRITRVASDETGLKAGTPVTYRSGDQPNNALSLKVLHPGEVAATSGTSGVIYGVTDRSVTDLKSRVNVFAHVNHSRENKRFGVLACINGAGIMNSWARRITGGRWGYDEMNLKAASVPPGSDGLTVYPFGNGAERILGNIDPGASLSGLNLNIHTENHIYRAIQEAVAYSFRYSFDIMTELGMDISIIRAGNANMFLSPLFRQLVSDLTGAELQLFNTDGATGAARGAAMGIGYYSDDREAFAGMRQLGATEPHKDNAILYSELYKKWKNQLEKELPALL